MDIRFQGKAPRNGGTRKRRCVCVGQVCLCDRCLYYLGTALAIFVTVGPAAILSQGHVRPAVTLGLALIALVSLLFIAFACAVNFLSALTKRHYHKLRESSS
jgi:hypothetical protein